MFTPKRSTHFLLLLVATAVAACLYSLQSPEFASDGFSRALVLRNGYTKDIQFGDYSHFLQVPLTYYFSKFIGWTSPKHDPMQLLIATNLVLLALGAYFFGLFSFTKTRSVPTAFFALLAFELNTTMAVYWNGEIVVPAIAFAAIALWNLENKRFVASAVLVGLTIALHIDFVFTIPFFLAYAVKLDPKKTVSFLLTVVLTSTLIIFLGAYSIGNISSFTANGIREYLTRGDQISDHWRTPLTPTSIAKSIKGLLATLFVGTYFVTDLFLGRLLEKGHYIVATLALLELIWLFYAIILVLRKLSKKELLILATCLFFPICIFNARFASQSEEYFGASSFILLAALFSTHVNWSKTQKIILTVGCSSWIFFQFVFLVIPVRDYGIARETFWANVAAIGKTEKLSTVQCVDELSEVDPIAEHSFSIFKAAQNSSDTEVKQSLETFLKAELLAGRTILISGFKCNAPYLKRYRGAVTEQQIAATNLDYTVFFEKLGAKSRALPQTYYPWLIQTDYLSWNKMQPVLLNRPPVK